MPTQVVEALINLGVLGPVLAAMAVYVVRRENRFEDQLKFFRDQHSVVQEARVADAQKVADRIVQLIDRQHVVMSELQSALEKHTLLLDRLRESVDRSNR